METLQKQSKWKWEKVKKNSNFDVWIQEKLWGVKICDLDLVWFDSEMWIWDSNTQLIGSVEWILLKKREREEDLALNKWKKETYGKEHCVCVS